MYQFAEVVHWMNNSTNMKLLPAHIDIDLTNICNQDCFYCNSAEFRSNKPVQKKYIEYIDLLNKIAAWRSHTPTSYGTVHAISYPGGGEPTLLAGFEHVIEHTIDLGFITSITTNGSKLHKLFDNISSKKLQKLAWVGIDIDAGTEDLYEHIRRSLTSKSLFNRVIDNAQNLIDIGVNVDFKCLLNSFNDNYDAINDLFALVKRVNGRKLFFRLAVVNNQVHPISETTIEIINTLSEQYHIPAKININRTLPRNYKKCHQMYHFPVFCADGGIYLCCENRGDPNFKLGNWDTLDFRDLWMSDKHHEIYNKIRVDFCQPCRPNMSNIKIQNIIDDPEHLETLFL